MLRDLNVDQARFIALLARTARTQRDALLGNVAEEDLDGVTPGRGERNPTAELGFEALPGKDSNSCASRSNYFVVGDSTSGAIRVDAYRSGPSCGQKVAA